MSKKEVRKIYRAKLDTQRSIVVGWPKEKSIKQEKHHFWQAVRALLF
jgi:hypothetical protein